MKTKAKTYLIDLFQHSLLIGYQCLRFLLFIGLGLFWHTTTHAQSAAPPNDSYVSFSAGQGSVIVTLPDTNTCSEIEVTLGSKSETGDLFANVYTYDQNTGLPSGLTYAREGVNVTVGIGAVMVPPAYNVKIRLKNTSGNWSSWYEYITN